MKRAIIAAPSSLNRLQVLLEESNNNDAFSFVLPGKFQRADNSQSVSYAQAYDQQNKTISDVLLVDYNDDGSVLLVVAHQDPGEPNWIDTAGHLLGTMCWRWIGATEYPPVNTQVVKLSDLAE